ncbi:RagB/SusD family nutrient uptake outer membrane protein [uncultured Mucilaginibacter sp.]|uniref:RagB/SusD family nutrient uptake outer membrane protein n=1 Tax=uncultured Mucilaginibacter sp. TaxID=797541 RepID=UPI0025D9BFAB|nr:RagB/SusD family nutrient uptake outer membrane protein [uncultured Mucilaginibacter sp.]
MKKTILSAGSILLALLITTTGCDKYLDGTQLPAKTIDGASVYESDVTTSTVITGVYINMTGSGPFTGSTGENMGYTLGLYTDELKSVLSGNFADRFYKNTIQSADSKAWSNLYSKLFAVNSAIEGINNSTASLTYRNQWLGESYFLRAYFHLLLTGYYGDIPLALTTDYTVNNTLSRAPQKQVYEQIIADLKQAQSLLTPDYRNGYGVTTTNRLRPNKAVATALLARVYLYNNDWANAEAQATEVINNTATYQLIPPAQVFLANSRETLWALAPSSPKPAFGFNFFNNGMPAVIASNATPASSSVFAALSNFVLNAFEPNDARFTNWVRSSTVSASATAPATVYYFPNKYKSSANNAEYEIIMRLAEQYLIRAEARARQNKPEAANDLNAVRTRAGLANTTASSPVDLLAAIAKERQTELFTESGHRFFDLKRTGTIDAVMAIVAPTKPTTWSSYLALWPIPSADIIQNPNIKPNPGYIQ